MAADQKSTERVVGKKCSFSGIVKFFLKIQIKKTLCVFLSAGKEPVSWHILPED